MKAEVTKKDLELFKEAAWMAILWGRSLIDSNVPNGKTDLKKATRAYKKIEALELKISKKQTNG